jgi:hypothetical protein
MKKIIVIMSVIVLSVLTLSVNAQADTVKPVQVDAVKGWDAKNNPTVTEIVDKYKDKYIATKPAPTTADIFPAIGKYESATNMDAASVTITLDAENKGLVWIEGLPQGKIKAMLRKSPATYKIPAQKTEDGKDVAEGTVLFDKETNTLSIIIGKNYNAAEPAAAFASESVEETVAVSKATKTKKTVAAPKPWIYTGTKVEKAVAIN